MWVLVKIDTEGLLGKGAYVDIFDDKDIAFCELKRLISIDSSNKNLPEEVAIKENKYGGYGCEMGDIQYRLFEMQHALIKKTYTQIMDKIKQLITQFSKFGIVGVIAFFIDYGTMILLTELFNVPYIVSTTIGFTVSVIFNYFASMKYVFKRRDDMDRKKEFIIFIVLSVIGLGINDALMFVTVDVFGGDYRLMKIIVTGVVMVYNFVTRKIFLEEKQET